jgi:hypothetical protein
MIKNILYKSTFVFFCLLLNLAINSKVSTATKSNDMQVVCKVGGTEVACQDILYRRAIETCYADGIEAEEATALFILIRNAISLEVSCVHNVGPTEKEIDTMSLHADRSSQDPKLLADIKCIFGKDIQAYNKLYLSSKITNRKLRSYYSRDRKIHAQAISKIEAAWYDAMNGGDFSKTAKKYDLEYKKLTPGRLEDVGRIPGNPGKFEAAHNPLSEIVTSMEVGEVHKNIVESDRDFKIVKLVERDGDKYALEVVSVEKYSYSDWYREQEKKIDVVFNDRKLYEQMLNKYPDTLWLKDARLIECSKD